MPCFSTWSNLFEHLQVLKILVRTPDVNQNLKTLQMAVSFIYVHCRSRFYLFKYCYQNTFLKRMTLR